MGKQPATGQKKTKEQIAKAAQAKKGGKKKWTKGKAKDKVQHAVFLERKRVDEIVNNPSKVGKVLTVANVIEKHKLNGSVARGIIRMMAERKTAEFVSKNNNQWVYLAVGGKAAANEGQQQQAQGGKQDAKKGGQQQQKKQKEEKAQN